MLLAIVKVGGVPKASETLGVAETTVKTHLYRVFSKTGASREAILSSWLPDFPIRWRASTTLADLFTPLRFGDCSAEDVVAEE